MRWLETGKLCEAAICYTGDLHDASRSRYDLDYYLRMARALRDAGTHILGIKDMAGLVKPAAARELVHALKEETGASGPLPHPRHLRHRRGQRAGGGGFGRRRGGPRDGQPLRLHLPALPRLGGGGAARPAARHRARPGPRARNLRLLGGGARGVRGVRDRHAGAGIRGLPARDAGRAVHEPAGAGARPSASPNAGTRWPRPTPRSTGCSATS